MTGYRAKTVFDEYRKGWKDAGRSQPAPLDRFAYMGFVAVGNSEAEGLRRAELVKSYLQTNTLVAEPYKNPPGFMASSDAAKLFQRVGWRGPSHQMATKDGPPRAAARRKAASDHDRRRRSSFAIGTRTKVSTSSRGHYHTISWFGHFPDDGCEAGWDHEDAFDNAALFAREVMPRLRIFTPPRNVIHRLAEMSRRSGYARLRSADRGQEPSDCGTRCPSAT